MDSANTSVKSRGFTVLELIVAVSVTAVLSGMLLLISNQVLETKSKSTAELERNQLAHFILDQIQEDLQCSLFRNDGNIWMAISLLNDKRNSGAWVEATKSELGKPSLDSLRIIESDWPTDELLDSEIDPIGQGPFEKSRFGVAGTWLRFFSQTPELDPTVKNQGTARAIAYQIVRYGITDSITSRQRYQLFRSDVSAKNTFEAGYNLYPNLENSGYGVSASQVSLDPNDPSTPRIPSTIVNPIISEGSDYPTTSFSLGTNVIDFGIRAYRLEKNSFGTGNLVQIFPVNSSDSTVNSLIDANLDPDQFFATSRKGYQYFDDSKFYQFPDVIDIMIRVLSEEGAKILESYENGELPNNESINWWNLAEEHSRCYIRRVKIYGRGI